MKLCDQTQMFSNKQNGKFLSCWSQALHVTRYIHHGLALWGGSAPIPPGPRSHSKPCAYISTGCNNRQPRAAVTCAALSLTTESVKADAGLVFHIFLGILWISPPCIIFHSDLSYSASRKCFYGCMKFAGIIITQIRIMNLEE